jgi:hypothetical protein
MPVNPSAAVGKLQTSTAPHSALSGPHWNAEAAAFSGKSGSELKEAFSDFVGQTFFGQLIASMRKTVDKPAYFHGGRAEEVFQGQLDQMLAERVSDSSREQFAEPMFELFMMQRPA